MTQQDTAPQGERSQAGTEETLLRPTRIEIDLERLVRNYHAVCAHRSGARGVMPIVKANAYGHGIVECSKALEGAGAPFFGVALCEEAVELRQAGIQAPILVMGGIPVQQVPFLLRHNIDMTASSISKLETINEIAATTGRRARVHLKIDTGLERIGVHHYNADLFLERALECTHSDLVGIFSHFATVKQGNLNFADTQLERFLEVVRFFEKRSLPTPIRHIAASAATFQMTESHLDLVRIGAALYGLGLGGSTAAPIPLEPVMRLRSEVVFFKVVKKGAGVSYGHTWRAPEDTRVVTIPIGYGDGYSRRLSNVGSVLIRGRRYPIVGTICMDQLMVNIGQDEAFNGDEVVLIGAQRGDEITVSELAHLVGTDPRDVVVSLNQRIPRVFKGR